MNTRWTCEDGTQVRVKDMSDTHLLNTISYLEQKVYYTGVSDLFGVNCDVEYGEDLPIYKAMCKEARKRGFNA